MSSWFRRVSPRCSRNTRRRSYPRRPSGPIWLHQLRQLFRRSSRRRGYFLLRLEGLEDRALPSGGITEYLVPSANSFPEGITSGPDGALWFTELGSNKIGRVSTSGAFTEFTIPSANSAPTGITSGPDGALWFTELATNKIGRITTGGVFTEYTIPTANSGVEAIVAGPDGALWFTEDASKIGRITTAGVFTEYTIPSIKSSPERITVGADGALWFTENSTNKIGRITTAGVFTEYTIPTVGAGPEGITTGPDGALWFTEDANKIGRVTTSGVFTEYTIPTASAGAEAITPGLDGALWFTEDAGKIDRITTAGAITEINIPTAGSIPEEVISGPDGGMWFVESGTGKVGEEGFDLPLSATGKTVSATEGSAFTGAVASFTDLDRTATAGNFTATINWGDGTTSAGTIAANGSGGFDVTGTHTFAEEGSSPITVTIQDVGSSRDSGGQSATAKSTATIGDASLTSTGAVTSIAATEGSSTGNQVVATFRDADPAGAVADYTATIAWGDGTTSAGTITAGAGGAFNVSGSHTYAEEGRYSATVTIRDAGGSTASAANTTFQVGDASLTVSGKPVAATEGAAFTGAVASFTDSDPNAAAGDYTATITWGDGQTSAGTVTANGSGGFDVTGTNTYAEEGSYAVSVTITDIGGSTATANTTAVVADAPLTGIARNIGATRKVLFNGRVASFLDADPNGTAGDYTATINWGDGRTSAGTITPDGSGGFDVSGTHTYKVEGTFVLTVTIQDRGGSTTTTTSTAYVPDAPLTASPQNIRTTEDTAFNGVVAAFTDADSNATAGDYTASITWGDGQTSAGTVTANGSGGFDVTGAHTYAEEGSYGVTVQIQDVGGSTATANSTAAVADAVLGASGQTITPTERAAFSGIVATFTDADPGAAAGDFTATIAWGDGQTTAGTVTVNGSGGFDVNGSNTYAEEGSYAVSVTIRDAGGSTASARGTATVGDALLTSTGAATTLTATEGQGTGSQVLATFTDPGTDGTAGDYTATIAWGDGRTSSGTVIPAGGGTFSVSGAHTYAEEGSYGVTVTIKDVGGSTATARNTTFQVRDAALSASGKTVRPTEGAAFTGVVASFTDANPGTTAADFAAAITWGDGHTSTGTVTANGSGGFDVTGSNTYVEEGSYAVSVSITDDGGNTATANGSAVVADAPLTFVNTTRNLTAAPGVSTGNQVVTQFRDANPNGPLSDYTAVITWGDGTTSPATISRAGGAFNVTGSHTYGQTGAFAVHVTLSDVGGFGPVTSSGTTADVGAVAVVPTPQPASQGSQPPVGVFLPPSNPQVVYTPQPTESLPATGYSSSSSPGISRPPLDGPPNGPYGPTDLGPDEEAPQPKQTQVASLPPGLPTGPTSIQPSGPVSTGPSAQVSPNLPGQGGTEPPGHGIATPDAVERQFQTDLLWKVLDARAKQVDADSRAQAVDAVFAAGLSALASVGFILWNTQYGYLLFSALTARPLWKEFDPLAVLHFWEKESKKRKRPAHALSEEEEEARLGPLFG